MGPMPRAPPSSVNIFESTYIYPWQSLSPNIKETKRGADGGLRDREEDGVDEGEGVVDVEKYIHRSCGHVCIWAITDDTLVR